MKLSAVVCERNQRHTILDTLDRLHSAAVDGWRLEVVVVDNHSTDGTRDLLRDLDTGDLQVIYQPRPRTPDACWRAAIAHLSGDYVLFDQHHASLAGAELAALAAVTRDGPPAVFATPQSDGLPPRRDAVTRWVNLLFGGNLSDVTGSTKLVRADVLRALKLHGGGIGLELDLTARLLRAGLSIRQVAVARRGQLRLPERAKVAALWGLLLARLDPSPIWKRGQRPADLDAASGHDAPT